MNEIPYILEYDNIKAYGILRLSTIPRCLIILLPALTGTHVGPQRLFVEISRELTSNSYSTLCIDIPQLPFKELGIQKDGLSFCERHFLWLKQILNEIQKKHQFTSIFLLSISYGCLPILLFAKEHSLSGVIMLSPSVPQYHKSIISWKNLSRYFYKLQDFNTWKKIFLLRLSFGSIFQNIIRVDLMRCHTAKVVSTPNKYNSQKDKFSAIDVLSIIGGRKYKIEIIYNDIVNYKSFQEIQLHSSDHSYFGWKNKQAVIRNVLSWLNRITGNGGGI
jgi:esterase/lipase